MGQQRFFGNGPSRKSFGEKGEMTYTGVPGVPDLVGEGVKGAIMRIFGQC